MGKEIFRVVIGDDDPNQRKLIEFAITFYGKNDRITIIGQAASADEFIEQLNTEPERPEDEQNEDPTIYIIDDGFPKPGDGKRVRDAIKNIKSNSIVISLSGSNVTWGDYNLPKTTTGKELVEFIINLRQDSN